MGLQFKHITSTATFNTTKFSASSGDNTYFTGADPNTQVAGTPDILYKDLVFCKCNGKIYTHGKFYETGDSNGDSYTEYLQSQATKANKHLILSGAEVVESNVAGYYRRTDAFVYIKDLGIVSVVPLGSDYQNLNPTFQLWRCGRNTIPEREWQYFWTNVQPSSSYPIVEKVCDWSDLVRLSDLEVPIATEYQNGLVRVDSELNESSPNPIANSAVANKLLFINTSYFNQNADRAVDVYILLCTIKFLYNSGVATLYCNQEYNIGAPFYVKTDILYRYGSVSVGGIMSLTENLNIKVEIDANEYVKIFLKTSYKCTGRGVYTILGHLAEFIPNGEF